MIVPANGFAATENAVLSVGAVPVLADYTLDPADVAARITTRTRRTHVAAQCRVLAYHGFTVGRKNVKTADFGFERRLDDR